MVELLYFEFEVEQLVEQQELQEFELEFLLELEYFEEYYYYNYFVLGLNYLQIIFHLEEAYH